MTGRGKYYYHRPRPNSDVTIGLTLSFSPEKFDPTSSIPLYLVITGRILKTPHPEKPITFATTLTPFDFISDRSFKNIVCTSSPAKQITIWPKSHFKAMAIKNVREYYKFVTIQPGKTLEVRHEVPRDAIREVGLENGERYKAEMTDMGLGTSWWMFGSLEEKEDVKFKTWSEEKKTEENKAPEDDDEEEEAYMSDEDDAEWYMGEDPMRFALVIQNGEAEVEIVS